MGLITFNGVSSDTLGLQITGRGAFNSPPKSYELISIPHRNGDIILDNGRFENIDVTYPAIFLDKITIDNVTYTYAQNKTRVRQWLNAPKGYVRLTDSYNPSEYRLACFKEAIEINDYYFEAGELELIFNCRPERFLASGDQITTISSSSQQITNPGVFSSKPLLKVNLTANSSGTFTIRDYASTKSYTLTISALPNNLDYVYIDCDLQQCYYGQTNMNPYVQVDEFPELAPGRNVVTFADGVTSIEITPRWWVI